MYFIYVYKCVYVIYAKCTYCAKCMPWSYFQVCLFLSPSPVIGV